MLVLRNAECERYFFLKSVGIKTKTINKSLLLDEWMDDLRFYVLFNSISVMSGRCSDDNEKLCAMELHLRLRRFHIQ